jgi:N-acetylglucosamine-6-phosphate deacetylase
MPSATFEKTDHITKFTNCRLVKGDELLEQDLWVSSITGKILRSQEEFYTKHTVPDMVIDLGRRIVSPGLTSNSMALSASTSLSCQTTCRAMARHYGRSISY